MCLHKTVRPGPLKKKEKKRKESIMGLRENKSRPDFPF